MSRSLWANFSQLFSGMGTIESPFSYEQIQNYFDPDVGVACGIVPINGDIIYAEGIINLINQDVVFDINVELSGSVMMKAKSVSSNPWFIEMSDNTNNDITVIHNKPDKYITGLEIRDFVICRKEKVVPPEPTTTTTTSAPAPVDFNWDVPGLPGSHNDIYLYYAEMNGRGIVFTDTSIGATSWLWDFDDGTTSTLENPPEHIYVIDPGDYVDFNVTLTINGIHSKSVEIAIDDEGC